MSSDNWPFSHLCNESYSEGTFEVFAQPGGHDALIAVKLARRSGPFVTIEDKLDGQTSVVQKMQSQQIIK